VAARLATRASERARPAAIAKPSRRSAQPSMGVSNYCSCGGGGLNAMRSEPLEAVFHPPSAGRRCSVTVALSLLRFLQVSVCLRSANVISRLSVPGSACAGSGNCSLQVLHWTMRVALVAWSLRLLLLAPGGGYRGAGCGSAWVWICRVWIGGGVRGGGGGGGGRGLRGSISDPTFGHEGCELLPRQRGLLVRRDAEARRDDRLRRRHHLRRLDHEACSEGEGEGWGWGWVQGWG
jgi:hypothetical protein